MTKQPHLPPHDTLHDDWVAAEENLEQQAIRACWARYKALGDSLSRERLIVHYAPLVSIVATRVRMRLPASVEHADLVSSGMFGLIDAIEKYSLSRDVQFETYASSRIRGAIIDELRALDWTPRSVRSKARVVHRAVQELEATLLRNPTVEEIAQHMKVSVREVQTVYSDVAHGAVFALDEVMASGSERTQSMSRIDIIKNSSIDDPEAVFQQRAGREILTQSLEHLSDRERLVVILYYFEKLTLAEIGRFLGVTESRVSQMHSSILKKLRSYLIEAERG